LGSAYATCGFAARACDVDSVGQLDQAFASSLEAHQEFAGNEGGVGRDLSGGRARAGRERRADGEHGCDDQLSHIPY
jgi:hypothetical protein